MKHRKQSRGQTLVEFALIIPIALLLIMGFFDLGRAVFYYSSISNMVREGARYAIVDPNSATGPYKGNINFMNGYSFGLPVLKEDPETACSVTGPCTFSSEDGDLVVTITRQLKTISLTATYTFKPITPGIAQILGAVGSIDLVAQSTMRLSSHVR